MLCFALMFVFGYILHGLESSPMLEVSWYVFWVTFVIVSKVDLNLAIFCYFHCNHVEPAKRLVEISLHREGALRPISVWTWRGGFERCASPRSLHCLKNHRNHGMIVTLHGVCIASKQRRSISLTLKRRAAGNPAEKKSMLLAKTPPPPPTTQPKPKKTE